jgi:hypothetical protein
MKTINSLSGGKTSSYMSMHYPADYNIFSLVTINEPKAAPKDLQLAQYVSDKIGKEFIATAEDDATLYVMRDLEQMLGKEIIWVVGESFDNVINKAGNYLPNKLRRFCTQEMKMRPIFDWWFNNIGEKVKMAIGYRYDEMERAGRFTTSFKGVVGKRGTQNKWDTIEWREGYFPLIENKIIHPTIVKWANQSGLQFPSDSNCIGCFHKHPQQLRKNWEQHPEKYQWFADIEQKSKGTWKENETYERIKTYPKQIDFEFGGGSGCDAGFCTD